jgi:nucleotide-binding universal stress UspA family protein
MFKNITAAIDGSDSSIKALDYAAHLANNEEATLHIISAAEPLPPISASVVTGANYYPQYQDDIHKALEEIQTEQLKRLNKLYPTLKIETQVIDGRPVPVIKQATKGTDLIVLGHRGHGAILSLMLGSVAKQIVDTCTAPVLIVKDQDYCPA